jgi:hypothetical protein
MSVPFVKLFLPYCVERVEGDLWVVLNRGYKPLGQSGRDWVDYRPHAVRMRLTPAAMRAIDWQGHEGPDKVWLYADACGPHQSPEHWQAYQQRLARLAGLKVGEA